MKSELEITGSQNDLKILFNGQDITESVLDYSLSSSGGSSLVLDMKVLLTKIKIDTSYLFLPFDEI